MIDDRRFVNILLYKYNTRDYEKAVEVFRSLPPDYRDNIIDAMKYAVCNTERLWKVEAIITNPDLQKIEALRDGIEFLKSIYEKVRTILNRDKVEADESERELISKLLQSRIDILS